MIVTTRLRGGFPHLWWICLWLYVFLVHKYLPTFFCVVTFTFKFWKIRSISQYLIPPKAPRNANFRKKIQPIIEPIPIQQIFSNFSPWGLPTNKIFELFRSFLNSVVRNRMPLPWVENTSIGTTNHNENFTIN